MSNVTGYRLQDQTYRVPRDDAYADVRADVPDDVESKRPAERDSLTQARLLQMWLS
jgi:hypothetical protein